LAFGGSVDPEKVPDFIKEFEGVVETYNKELEKRGTKFFAGLKCYMNFTFTAIFNTDLHNITPTEDTPFSLLIYS